MVRQRCDCQKVYRTNPQTVKLTRSKKPIQFAALTLPHKQLPDYPDIGSWKVNADEALRLCGAADTGDDISNWAILIHEIVESMLCGIHGVKEEVSKFDQMWFAENHADDDEPRRRLSQPEHGGR
jgi:hypothetical protein